LPRRFAPRNDIDLTASRFLRREPQVNLHTVIANQPAGWCGNPSLPTANYPNKTTPSYFSLEKGQKDLPIQLTEIISNGKVIMFEL
jgi:hypothetical protein